ncbi:hypothetical protein [Coxiella endosymbiont of Ornithodoros maritimus]|uniref:hypothetical protein n=1 Tax=Coxiella endosymbiont of Ornithodoros maritimus TaxID=1656172 RepID=UPI002264EDD0|nr:hypothetical protein [Coxiella endosymbiont of Ornithodoros maritimus]
MTAGARSIFMLANIGDATFHKNLKRDFNVNSLAPKNLVDQWETFKAIAEHEKSKWSLVLIMSGVWIEKMRKDPRWQEFYSILQEFYSILLENSWIASSYERNQMFYQYAFLAHKITIT